MDKTEKYKGKITELVEKIENPATLKFILLVIKSYLKSRGIQPLPPLNEEMIWRIAFLLFSDRFL